jgi:hypothetical protein
MLTETPLPWITVMTSYDLPRYGVPRYGFLLYPSLEDAVAAGFERVGDNSDGVLLRKRAGKDSSHAFVLHPHLQGAYR